LWRLLAAINEKSPVITGGYVGGASANNKLTDMFVTNSTKFVCSSGEKQLECVDALDFCL